jgi:protein arginine kinase activator
MKCEICGKATASVHLTEIKNGKKIEKHLCEQCAAQSEGLSTGKSQHMPINELLTNFVMNHSGLAPKTQESLACPHCGITWAEFRQSGLLGCEHDYPTFEKEMTPLLQRAHEGAAHHVGKVPTRRGGSGVPVKRALDAGKLKKELARAVETEDYEKAAKLRDQIRQAEG